MAEPDECYAATHCWACGGEPLRPDDYGPLSEYLVLQHLQAHFPDQPVRYWRDKAGREVDFVLACGRDDVHLISRCRGKRQQLLAFSCHSWLSRSPRFGVRV